MTPQRSGVRARVRARSGCAEVGGTRRRPRGAGRLAGTDLNCPGGARSVSRAHSAAGAPTQIRGWARTGVSTCGGRGRRLHCAAWCLVVCPRRRARPKPPQPTCGGRGRRLHCAAWSCVRAVPFVGTHHPSPCANLISISCMYTYSVYHVRGFDRLPCVAVILWVRPSSVCCCYTL